MRVIIDCTEIAVEHPLNISHRVFLFYKKGFRVKILEDCSPHGLISFISEAFDGWATDSKITTQSSFLDLLEPRNVVLDDKGFPQIKMLIDESQKGVLIVLPPFLRRWRSSRNSNHCLCSNTHRKNYPDNKNVQNIRYITCFVGAACQWYNVYVLCTG